MMANELMLTLIIAASILSILTVIRHTRAEEESGIAELVLSSVVGRYARTYAALILVGGVNARTRGDDDAGDGRDRLRASSTPRRCASASPGCAMVFGAVAAVTAQLWRQARAATGAAMAALALAALVRGIGDVINNSGSALSWFSPIAWAQQMRAFVDLRWWPFALLVALTIGLMALAAWLESRRQYDDGSHPVHRRAPERASDQERVRSAPDAAARSDDRLDRRTVPGRLGIWLDDQVAARRGEGQPSCSHGCSRRRAPTVSTPR